MTSVNDFNANLIDEFRANDGKVGGQFAGSPLMLLTTTGAKSGAKRTSPVVYLQDGDRIAIFGSKGGAPTNPAWYHNIVANPDVTIEMPGETYEGRATVADGAERDRIWAAQKQAMPAFADYEKKTDRQIPVIVIERTRA